METDWELASNFSELSELIQNLGNIQVYEANTKVCSYSSNILHSEANNQKMKDSLIRSGITDYLSEFFPASYDSDLRRLVLKFDSMHYSNYPQFLHRVIDEKLVVPDTNVLIDRVLTRRILAYIG